MNLTASSILLIALLVLFDVATQTLAWTTSTDGRRSQMAATKISIWNDDDKATQSRRTLLVGGGTAAASLIVAFASCPDVCHAAVPLDAGEAIRRGAANLPGLGPTDVFYPASLAGNWTLVREVEFPAATLSTSAVDKRLRLEYPFRFIPSIDDSAVLADRGANQAALETALMRQATTDPQQSPSVRSVDWSPSNPNDWRMVLSDGSTKDIKVTKRATEWTESTVTSSEFQRVTQTKGQGGIPSISARRILTKCNVLDDSTVEGLEIVYAMGGGDPLSAGATSSSVPTVLSKSRLLWKR